jgi:hypothetical protein
MATSGGILLFGIGAADAPKIPAGKDIRTKDPL